MGFRSWCALSQINSLSSCTCVFRQYVIAHVHATRESLVKCFSCTLWSQDLAVRVYRCLRLPFFFFLSGNHKYRPFRDALHMSEVWWPGLHHHLSLCGVQRSRRSQAEEEGGDPCACRWVWGSSTHRGWEPGPSCPCFWSPNSRRNQGLLAFSTAPVILKICTHVMWGDGTRRDHSASV